jgi:hypothetical protein
MNSNTATLLTNHSFVNVLIAVRAICTTNEVQTLGDALYACSEATNTTMPLLRLLIETEFERATATNSQNVILRGNTITSKLIDHVIQRSISYLKHVLSEPLEQVLSEDSLNLELNPDKTNTVELNIEKLKLYSSLFLDRIMSKDSIEQMPQEIKLVSHVIHECSEKYNVEELPLLAGVVILRYYFHTVLNCVIN